MDDENALEIPSLALQLWLSTLHEQQAYGRIYKITSTETHKVYIGQTTKRLKDRWKGHKCCFRDYQLSLTGRESKYSSHCYCLYRAMHKYGFETFRIDEIETADSREELNELEVQYIKQFDCLAPRGYNITPGGAHNRTVDPNRREEIRQRIVVGVRKNLDKKRKSDEAKGLPHYVQFSHPKDRAPMFQIQNHPKCKLRCFTVVKYGSLEAAKTACLEFYDQLETTETAYVKAKKRPDLPVGITVLRDGYKVSKVIRGEKCIREFLTGGSNEKNLENAKEFLQEFIDRKHEERESSTW